MVVCHKCGKTEKTLQWCNRCERLLCLDCFTTGASEVETEDVLIYGHLCKHCYNA